MVKLVPKSEDIKKKLDEIEAEMKRFGMWSKTPPHKEAFEDMGAFGMKTMSFDQWLQFVFVPNVRKLLKTDGPWPDKSEVGIMAVREFDGNPELGNLVALLTEFDMLF
ncbi:YqcC family protein [Candidatus Micrarchaeota archaeon]|nr:YqcC family protein [Candidatus Micrarchaeota archaeon]